MHTLTDQEIKRNPQGLFEGALRGESTLVLADGHAVMMAVPLGVQASTTATLLDLAAQLYDGQEISLGRAAEIAGVAYGDMVTELGRRGIATLRLQPGDLEREVAAFGP
jgi:predicted HTH domain antitoxin